MYNLDHVVVSGWVLFFYLMLAVLLHLLAVRGILVHDGLSSGVDAGLSSFLGMSCHFLAPFRQVSYVKGLVISVKVGPGLYFDGFCEY